MAPADIPSTGFYRPVSFAACSYVKPDNAHRRKLVKKTFQTWNEFLSLPFTERIFLDDRSPDSTASRILASAGLAEKFDRVLYQSEPHPPHSNFGIVGVMDLCQTPYILHLDDDVSVVASAKDCFHWIDLCIRLMEADSSIQGVNLGRVTSAYPPWYADQPYPPGKASGLYHPKALFGSNAGLVRRSLLDRVGFAQIQAWDDKQPKNWEELVCQSPSEFLVGLENMPFYSSPETFYFTSTRKRSPWDWLKFQLRRCLIYCGLIERH